MTKYFQVPDLLPVEKAHLRAGWVSYRSPLLAVLRSHKGNVSMAYHLVANSQVLDLYYRILTFPHCAAGVVRVGCDDTDSIADP
jgi:hypothetical protein